MTDTRSDSCMVAEYDRLPGKDTVSILMDFHETQLYDLKMTLESIKKNTPHRLIKEIILLDDGSGSESITKHTANYIHELKISAEIKAYRSEEKDGPGVSRFKASKVATGSILVFLTSEVAVNKGWLEPLLDAIQSDRHLVAVPHTDNLLSGYRFLPTSPKLINVFNWKLDILFMESIHNGRFLTSPVMSGAAFAIDRNFLDSIGNIDESLGQDGGDGIELSFRIWLCGGSIKVVTCSNVAVKNALKPITIDSTKNFQRIVEMWMDMYKKHAYRQSHHSYNVDSNLEAEIRIRRAYFKNNAVTCGDFKTYLQKTATMIMIPPNDSRDFGKVKSKTGYCLDLSTTNADQIKMLPCRPHLYETDMLFTLDFQGRLRSQRFQCVQLTTSQDVQFRECQNTIKEQHWTLSDDGTFRSSVQKNSCLSHEYEDGMNYLAVKPCVEGERSMQWSFIPY